MDYVDEIITLMSSEELLALEQRLTQVLQLVKDRKMQIVMEELNQSKMREQRAYRENHKLRGQIRYLQGLIGSDSGTNIVNIQDSETTLSRRPSTNFKRSIHNADDHAKSAEIDSERTLSLVRDDAKSASQDSERTLSLDPPSDDTMAEASSSNSHTQGPTSDLSTESEASSRNSHT